MERIEDKCAIFVKNFPKVLMLNEKRELLKTMGATNIDFVGPNCARASFGSESETKEALYRIHQMDIMGHKLIATFAKSMVLKDEPHLRNMPVIMDKIMDQDSMEGDKTRTEDFVKNLMAISKDLNFTQPPNPYLRYNYPSATPEIVRVIGRNLLAVPKFYTQVLHLMNRMNLVPPFYGIAPNSDTRSVAIQVNLASGHDKAVQFNGETLVGTDESELESEDDCTRPLKRLAEKRKHVPTQTDCAKKIRSILIAEKHKTMVMKTPPELRANNEIFENNTQIPAKMPKIIFNEPFKIDPAPPTKAASLSSSSSGSSSSSSSASSISRNGGFLSDKELMGNRISPEQLLQFPVFSQYTPGVPSNQLYVKNISKDVSEDDLRYIFGRYSKSKNDVKIDCKFQGKYRGQAWVKFNSEAGVKLGERQVDRALREIHGYILKNKPLHVSYARSVYSNK